MKTYTIKNKCLAALGSMALLIATPSFAQSDVSRDSRATEMRESADLNSPTIIEEPAGASNETNWSWLGLLGLAGLFGLKRHHDVRESNYRPMRT